MMRLSFPPAYFPSIPPSALRGGGAVTLSSFSESVVLINSQASFIAEDRRRLATVALATTDRLIEGESNEDST